MSQVSTKFIANSAVTLAKLANLAANSAIANSTGSSATPTAVSMVNTATASSIMFRDSNANSEINNMIQGYTTTATGATTTTLTVSSTYLQYFTGTTTQTVVLPATSTLVLGQQFLIDNRSTGVVTVESSGAISIQAMASDTQLLVTVISTSLNTAAAWDAVYSLQVLGANTALSNLANVAINTALLPSSGGINLGSTTDYWNNIYASKAYGSAGTGYVDLVAYYLVDNSAVKALDWKNRFLYDTAATPLQQMSWGTTGITIGVNGTTGTGKLNIANATTGGAAVTIQNLGTTSAYNFNLPISAGTANQVLTSQAGGSTSMTWTTVPGNTSVLKVPTTQIFAAGYYYTFTIAALTTAITAGATYTNNGQTFTIIYSYAIGATSITASAPSSTAPTSSGILILSTGTGQSSVTFSAEVATGTYILPTNPSPLYIIVEAVGGGGGGGGGGTRADSPSAGSAGNNTTFGTSLITAGGGGAGQAGAGGSGQVGTGGTASGPTGSMLIIGGMGTGAFWSSSSSPSAFLAGSPGGSSAYGGAGGGQANGIGLAGQTNTGGGGAGGGVNLSGSSTGGGGGAGGFVRSYITSLSSTYSFAVGLGGGGGAAGSSGDGFGGGAGGSGYIIVREHYQ